MTHPRIPRRPKHPERICWGCERYCPITNMGCPKDRTPHPIELFDEGWDDGDDETQISDEDDRRFRSSDSASLISNPEKSLG